MRLANSLIKYIAIITLLYILGIPVGAKATETYTQPNGLQVLLLENHRAPVVSMRVWVKVGSSLEKPGEYGLAHLTEHMLFKGTSKRGPGEIARVIEASGGRINAYTSLDQTVYFIDMAGRFHERGLDILSDMVFHPSFDPEEFAREKEVVLEEIRMDEDDPSDRLSKELFSEAFKAHPYGRPVIGSSESVRNITREKAVDFQRRWYRPNNMILIVAGDFDSDRIKPVVERYFGGASPREIPIPDIRPEPAQDGLRVQLIEQDVEISRLNMGFRATSFNDQDTPALDLLAEILGSGRTSRLYREVKRNRELVHTISAWSYTPKEPGLFGVSAQLDAAKGLEAIESIMSEVARLSDSGVEEAELARAKLSVKADFIRSQETMSGEAGVAADFQAMTGDYRTKEKYLDRLDNLTTEDLKAAADRYLKASSLSLILMIPPEAKKGIDEARIVQAVGKGASSTKTAAPDKTGVSAEGAIKESGARHYVLNNGARLLVKPDHSLPIVAVRASFLGGLRYENRDNSGLNNLLAEVWDRATTRLSPPDLSRALEDMAAEISSFSGRNSFGLSASLLASRLDQGLALFGEILTDPALDPKEVEKARPNILAAIKRQQDQMPSRTFRLFSAELYKGHPYGRDILGEPDTVTKLTATDLRAYYEKWVKPNNVVLAVVGDVDPEEIKTRLETLLAGWKGQAPDPPDIPDVSPWEGLKQEADPVDRAQTHLVLGFIAPGMKSDDRFALEVMDAVLSGMGGRLFVELRDKQSLAYSVSSFYTPGLGVGSFGLYIAFDPDKIDKVHKAFETTLKELIDKPISQKELEGAKEYILGNFEIGLQRYSAQAADMGYNELYGLGPDYRDRYIQGISGVTVEDVMRVAKKYLNMNQAVEVTVGTVAKK